MKYAWVKNHCDSYDVNLLCDVLEVSRSGYYRWLHAKPSETAQRSEQIADKARQVFDENYGSVGYRKVYKDLQAQGVACCPETVRKALARQGLQAAAAPCFVPTTTDSDHDLPIAPNQLDRDFSALRPNAKWVSDITYIRTGEGWLYLCAVLDLYSGKVVGWSMAPVQDRHLVLKAVMMACWQRSDRSAVILHSDRGTQFTSAEYQQFLADHHIISSMSDVGHCGDNAAAEGFFGKLKRERVHRRRYLTLAEARSDVFDYIERFHNPIIQRRLDARDQTVRLLTQPSVETG